MNNLKILSTGVYLPKKIVKAEEFDKIFNLEKGWTYKKSGVKQRHYVTDETQVDMAVNATEDALKKANIKKETLECIIFSGGVCQQLIPCTASLIQRALGLGDSGIPCFDINSTCLSFVTALDTASYFINNGKYKRILVVSSDIASVGIDYADPKSCILFGDGAGAVIVEKADKECPSKIFTYKFKTYGNGADHACIKGGGTSLYATNYNKENEKDFLFHMDGTKLYEIATRKMGQIFNETLSSVGLTLDDIRLIIPHQASLMSMKLLQKKLRIPDEKFMYNIENVGNTIASSIPIALNEALDCKRIKRGDKIMLVGTSAGLSIGVMILEY